MDLQTALVVNEPQFLEFIHEEIDAGAGRADHLCQHLLGDFWNHCFGLIFLAIASEEKKSTGEPFLGRIEKLIDQILLDSDVSYKHVGYEAV